MDVIGIYRQVFGYVWLCLVLLIGLFLFSFLLCMLGSIIPYACNEEWNRASACELTHHPHSPACCFGNISSFYVPAVQAMIPQLRSQDLFQSKLVPLVMSDKAVKMKLSYTPDTPVRSIRFLFIPLTVNDSRQ